MARPSWFGEAFVVALRKHSFAVGLLLCVAIVAPRSWAASGCRSTATGAWNSGSTWTGCAGPGGVPATTDNVSINGNTTVTLTTAATVASLTYGPSVSSTATLNVNSGGALTVSGTLNINGANGGSGKIALLNINTGGAVTVNGASGVIAGVTSRSRLTFTGTGTLTTTILAAGLTFTPFTGSTVVLTATGTLPTYPYANLRINGTGRTVTLGAAKTISGNLTIQAGTLDTSASNFAITVGGATDVQTGGTFNARASTINANGNLTGAGTIQFTGAGTLNIGGDNTTTGAFTASTSTVNYNKAGTQIARSGITYNNLTLSGSGAKNLVGPTTVSNALLLSGTATSTAGGALTLKDVTISGGTTLDLGSSSHTISGNVANNGTLSATLASVTFSGTAQSISGTATSFSVNNATINASSTLTPGASITTLNAGGTLTINGTLNPSAAQTISGGTLTGSGTAKTPSLAGFLSQYTATTKTLTNLTVDYNGVAAQTISGIAYGNLKISNSSGGTLNADGTVSGALTLAGGNITTGAFSLTLGGGGSVSRTSGFIIGTLVKTYNAASSKTFEVGTSNGYSPATVNATAGTFPAAFTVKVTQGAHPNAPGSDALRRYWTTTTSGITSADLTFNYIDPVDIAGSEANYSLGRWTGTAWVYPTATVDAVNNLASTTAATAFGDYSLHERATKLIITSVNGGADVEVNQPFAIIVRALDSSNNPTKVKDGTGISIDVFSGTQASLGGTTTGTMTANSETLMISGLTYTTAESVILRANSTSGDALTAGNSPSFNVVTFSADHIVITSSAADLPSGTSRNIVAELRDSFGNVNTSDNTTLITFAKTNGDGTVTGLTSQQVTAGVASIPVNGVLAGSITITASATNFTSGTTTFNIVAGAADHITFTSSTADLVSGNQRSLTAELRDANNNVRTSDNSTSVDFTQTGGSGSVSGLTPSTFSSGIASINVTGVTAGSVTITASSTGTTSDTSTFNVVVGTADHLTITSSTADLKSGVTRTLTAEIRDANQNVVTSDSSTSVTFAQTIGTGSVSGLGSATASNGIASKIVTGVNLGSVTVTASAIGISNGTTSFDVVVGNADHLTFTSSVADLESTTTRTLTAEIRDVNQHVLTTDSSTSVTFAQASGAGSVNGLTSTLAVNGIASLEVTGFTAGSVTITAHATSVPNDGSTTFNVVASIADHLFFTSSTADLNFNVSRTLTAEIRDANENVVLTDNTSSVTFTRTTGSGTVTGLPTSANASSGVASIIVTGGATPGPITITATTPALPDGDGVTTFNIVNSPPPASATPPYLVKNINPSGDSTPSFLTAMTDGRVIFSAFEAVGGTEPWISDGTLGGTILLKDIEANSASSSPSGFTTVNSLTFFKATTAAAGAELWSSLGTGNDTSLVKDINANASSSNPSSLTRSNNSLFFAADDGSLGTELWISNGTLNGTVLVQDSNPGAGSSSPQALADAGGTLFYSADSTGFGRELWMSNGTTGGTTMVANIASGVASSSPRNLSFVNGELYFTADATSAAELWTSDGTGGGTFRVHDINTGGDDNASVVLPVGLLGVFAADDGTNGRELWKTDGTDGGTSMIVDLKSGGSGVPAFTTANAVVAGGTLYFAADDGVHGLELWRSNGTAVGTSMVKDICPDDCSSNPTSIVVSGTSIYFRASNPYVGDELWVSDGTEAGTKVTGDLEPGIAGSSPESVTKASNLVYFAATTTAAGKELYAVCSTTTTQLNVTGPATATVGSSFSISVSPRDASSLPVPCYTGIVTFTSTDGAATLPLNYTFVTGEGAHSFSVTLNTPGNRTVTVTDTVTGTIVGNVVVNAVPVTPTASNGGPYCEGATIQLSTPTVSGGSYSWTGPNSFTSSVQNPTRSNATVADAGSYSVTVTVNSSTSAAGSTNVVVNPTPATPTASNGGPYCQGATIQLSTPTVSGATYAWTGPNGFTSALQNPTRSSAATADAGSYSVTVTVNGCTSSAGTTNVVVNATPATPTITAGGPTAFCEDGSVLLTSSAAAAYQWSLNGNPIVGATEQTYRAFVGGNYTVVVSNGCNSAPSAPVTVTVHPNPTPVITPSGATTFCSGGSVTLTSNSATGNQWYRTGVLLVGETNPTLFVNTSGHYSLLVTSANGCIRATTTIVAVYPKPDATITVASPMFSGAIGVASVNQSCLGSTFTWGITGGTITSGNGTPSITFTAGAAGTLTLSLTVTNSNGCSDFKTADVTVQQASFGAPPFLEAAANGSTNVLLNWASVASADHYEVYRSTDNINWSLRGSPAVNTFAESGVASTTYLYKVRAIKADTTASAYSAINAATTIALTDDPLSACGTLFKAVHITQLRTAINTARASVGLTPTSFTDPSLSAGSVIRAVHLTELRTALSGFLSAIAVTPGYTDPTIVAGTTVAKGAHIQELRNLVD